MVKMNSNMCFVKARNAAKIGGHIYFLIFSRASDAMTFHLVPSKKMYEKCARLSHSKSISTDVLKLNISNQEISRRYEGILFYKKNQM